MQYHLLCVAIDAPPDTEQSAPFQDEGGRVKSWLVLISNENCSITPMGRVYTSLHYAVAEQQNKYFYNTEEKN